MPGLFLHFHVNDEVPDRLTLRPAGPSNGIAGSSGWVYTLKLVVEDATATLDLILFGPDADCFFKDLPARDLRDEASAAAALRQRLQQLLGQGCQRWAIATWEACQKCCGSGLGWASVIHGKAAILLHYPNVTIVLQGRRAVDGAEHQVVLHRFHQALADTTVPRA